MTHHIYSDDIPFPSYGKQMQTIRADEALRRNYFDPQTAEIGDRIPYRNMSDATDDRAWHDAECRLSKRGLKLIDNRDGYSVVAE